jgi:NADPH:quinone reductase
VRALVCSAYDGLNGVALGELADVDLAPGSVRMAVEAAGVNYPDLLIVQGIYQDRPPLPFVPGFEVAGTVVETNGDVAFREGDRVFGYIRHGGYAESVVVEADRLYSMPDGMPSPVAAALPVAYGTSYHALVDRASLRAGETLLVLGAAGGVGMAAVQIGVALGARVIGAVSSDEKAQAVSRAGAEEVIRYDEDDLRTALRSAHPDGVDVVYDPVGGEATEAAFRSTAWGGRHLVIGFASGTIPSLPANLPLLKGASLVGVFWGRFTEAQPDDNRSNMETLIRWWGERSIDPLVSQTLPLERAMEALEAIGARRAIGKIVIEP